MRVACKLLCLVLMGLALADDDGLEEEKKVECIPGSKVFEYTGTIQNFTAPRNCLIVMALWGAGGSNSLRAMGGGGGGFIRGSIDGVGQPLYILVGEGAHGGSQGDRTQGPFFGAGGKQGWFCGHAGGGGGRSQVSLSPEHECEMILETAWGGMSNARCSAVDYVLIVAGGGGGAGTCPMSTGGSGGCRDDHWEAVCNGRQCNAEWGVWGKGAYSGRPHNEYFKGHDGGDLGGGGGAGFYGGGAGEGTCDFSTGGGGGSSWWNTELVSHVEVMPGNETRPGNSLQEYGINAGVGGTGPAGAGGHGLVLLKWMPHTKTTIRAAKL